MVDLNRYLAEEIEMPIEILPVHKNKAHTMIVTKTRLETYVPYLNELEDKISFYKEHNIGKFLIVCKYKKTARKVAAYICKQMVREDDADKQAHDVDFFGEELEFDEEDEPQKQGKTVEILSVDEVNIKTNDSEMDREKGYDVSLVDKSVCIGALITGLEDGADLDDKIVAIKAGTVGAMFIWVPENLIDRPQFYDLMIMENYYRLDVKDPEDNYYAEFFDKLLYRSGYMLEDGTDSLDIVQKLKNKLGDGITEELLDKAFQRAIIKMNDEKRECLTISDVVPGFEGELTAIERLESYIGLENAKMVVRQTVALAKEMNRNSKLKKELCHNNLIFCGNPGTGKTTIAELIAKCLAECGISNGVFVSASRSDLVGKFVGHSAPKVAEVFNRARGGVLFVDEAGFFLNNNSGGFVSEVLKEFVRYMEIMPEVTVIFGMYEREAEGFLQLDVGLRSRISRIVRFENYNDDEISQIAKKMFADKGYALQDGCLKEICDCMNDLKNNEDYGNARDVRRVVDSSILSHSLRIHGASKSRKKENPDLITLEDVTKGISEAVKRPESERKMGKIGFAIS